MTRSTVAQVVQIGVEATPGTAVPATKRLGSLGIAVTPEADTSTFRPKGTKYVVVVAENKVWSTADLSGSPTYDEIIYPLASVISAPTVTALMDGVNPTGATQWVFESNSGGADAPKTFTVEQGTATEGEQMAYGLVTDFDLDVKRSEVGLGGTLIGQKMKHSQPITAGLQTPDAALLEPILPGQFSVYLCDTAADLAGPVGASKVLLDRVLSAHPQWGKRYNPAWFLNAANPSFATHVETTDPDLKVDFMAEANAEGVAWLDRMDTEATKFLRLEAIGSQIYDGGGVPANAVSHRVALDFAVKVTAPGKFSDEDGVYALSPELTVVHDGTWGKAFQVTVVNKTAAL